MSSQSELNYDSNFERAIIYYCKSLLTSKIKFGKIEKTDRAIV